MSTKKAATKGKRNRDTDTPGKPRKILYVATCLADGDWNEFGHKKWAYLQEGNKDGALDIQMIFFLKGYHPKKDKYPSGTYQTQDVEKGKRELVKTSDVAAWDVLALNTFLNVHYEPGNTHLVIGTHGQGDSFYLEHFTEDGGKTEGKNAVPVHKVIKDSFLGKTFLSAILDCCLMGELYTMKHFNKITSYVGCAEGFQWAEDVNLDGTMFSVTSALALSDPEINTYDALVTTGQHFIDAGEKGPPKKRGRSDFGIYATTHAETLLDYIQNTSAYEKILSDTSALIIRSDSTKSSKYCFYTVPAVPGNEDVYDSQYLLDIWRIHLDYPEDKLLVNLFKAVVWWHKGQNCGSGMDTAAQYNFQLGALSVTCAHTPPTPAKKPAAKLTGNAADVLSPKNRTGTAKKSATSSKKKVSPKKATREKGRSKKKKAVARKGGKKKH